MAIEKLDYEDALMLDNIVRKVNEIVDNVNELEDHYNRRINNIYKFIRKLRQDQGDKNGKGE